MHAFPAFLLGLLILGAPHGFAMEEPIELRELLKDETIPEGNIVQKIKVDEDQFVQHYELIKITPPPGKEPKDYSLPRGKEKVDTLLVERFKEFAPVFKEFLKKGHSAHFIIFAQKTTREGPTPFITVVLHWIAPEKLNAKMTNTPWDKRSIEALVQIEEGDKIDDTQVEYLGEVTSKLRNREVNKIEVSQVADLCDVKLSGKEGKISNLKEELKPFVNLPERPDELLSPAQPL